jgi:hypothetical protein
MEFTSWDAWWRRWYPKADYKIWFLRQNVNMIVAVCFAVGKAHGQGCYHYKARFTLGVRADVQPKSSILLMQKLKLASRALQ